MSKMEASIISAQDFNSSTPEDNTLNKNVEFSELDMSGSEDMQNLSITLSSPEKKLLKATTYSTQQENAGRQSCSNTLLDQDEKQYDNVTSNGEGGGVTTAEGDLLTEETFVNENNFFRHSISEVARRLWPSTARAQNFTKCCSWSPDGTCLLVPINLDGMHVMELPLDLYEYDKADMIPNGDSAPLDLVTAVHVKEGGTVYDYVWYPFMNSSQPETCCWLATRQHEPIHMWDAFTGELRCSYRGYNDVDEVETAISVAFSNDGQRVFGGFKKSIKIFGTNSPGRDCDTLKVKQAISCFALTARTNETVTTGSWNGYINHYDLRARNVGSLFTLGGHKAGITGLRYMADSSEDWYLFSGARKDNTILLWDMRNYNKPVREFHRTVATNQRIQFDVSPQQQQWLVSGDTRGILHIWDLSVEESIDTSVASKTGLELPVHMDCLNGVNFHPTLPILATTSGQYHFHNAIEQDKNCSPSSTNSSEDITKDQDQIVDYENAVLLLLLSPNNNQQ